MPTISERLQVIFGVKGADKFRRELDQTRKKVETSSSSMAMAFKRIGQAAKAYIGIQAAKAVISVAKELNVLAAQNVAVSRSFQNLAKSIGQSSSVMLTGLRKAAKGAVSDLELMKQANTAMLLQIPVTDREMGKLAETAIKLGRAMGRAAASSIESIIVGLGRQSPLWLDNLGIVIKAEEAYKGLGATATDAQKKMAFFNAVMTKANEMGAKLGEQPVSGVERLGAAWDNFAAALAANVNPALETTAGLLATIATNATKAISKTKVIGIVKPKQGPLATMNLGTGGPLAPGAKGAGVDEFEMSAFGAKLDTMPAFRSMTGRQKFVGPNVVTVNGKRLSNKNMLRAETVSENLGRMYSQKHEAPKRLEQAFNETARRASDDFEKIPMAMEDRFNRALSNIQIGFAALGMQGRGLFSGIGNLTAGISGFNMASTMPAAKAGDGFLKRIEPGLLKFSSAMQMFAGAVETFQTAAGFLAAISREDFTKKSDAEIKKLADPNTPIEYNILGQRLEGQDAADTSVIAGGQADAAANDVRKRAQEEAARRGLTGVSSGSAAYGAAATITETQANAIQAVLETNRIQDAERNVLLADIAASNKNIEFATSVGAISALAPFHGIR